MGKSVSKSANNQVNIYLFKKSTIETLKKVGNMLKVNNKNTRTVLVFLLLTLNISSHLFREQVNVSSPGKNLD